MRGRRGAVEFAAEINARAVVVRVSTIPGAGRGLFVTAGTPAGAILTEYAGADVALPPPGLSLPLAARTHMLRVPDESRVIDGAAVASAVRVSPFQDEHAGGGEQWVVPPRWSRGLGALVNSAARASDANAKLVWAADNRLLPSAGRVDCASVPRGVWDVLPKAAFVVAKRALHAGEEVLWKYAHVVT